MFTIYSHHSRRRGSPAEVEVLRQEVNFRQESELWLNLQMATNSVTRFITSVVIPIVFVVFIVLSLPLVCGHGHDHDHHGHVHDHHGHSHDHGHHGHTHEAPAFKWSKEANEPYVGEEEEESDHHESQTTEPTPTKSSVWFDAIVATLGISIAPYLILFVIPVTNSAEHEPYLKILLAFASGGLLEMLSCT